MSKQENIAALQEALTLCGFSTGGKDGKMGPDTRGAIRGFQKSVGIGVDGSVGPATRAAIAEQLKVVAGRAQHLAGFFAGGGQSLEDDL